MILNQSILYKGLNLGFDSEQVYNEIYAYNEIYVKTKTELSEGKINTTFGHDGMLKKVLIPFIC